MKLFSQGSLQPFVQRVLLNALLTLPFSVSASPVGDALRQLMDQTYVNRTVRLSDLGFSKDILLTDDQPQLGIYFPLTEGIDLVAASINFRAKYVLNSRLRAGAVLSVGGESEIVELTTDPDGEIRKNLVVPKDKKTGKFIQLDVDWESVGPQSECANELASAVGQCSNRHDIGNRLAVSFDTALRYRFNSQSITNVTQAWQILPKEPVLLVAGSNISHSGFDTAWRVGTILGRLGRPVKVLAFPGIGDVVDMKDVTVPPALASIPAYAALLKGDQIAVSDLAQTGALLTLGAHALAADIAVVDSRLQEQINSSLDALQAQLNSDPDAIRAFNAWRKERMSLAAKSLASSGLTLSTFTNQSVLKVADISGSQPVSTFVQAIEPLLTSEQKNSLRVPEEKTASNNTVDIVSAGSSSPTFSVYEKGSWVANIPLSLFSADGRSAESLTIDVSAATDPSGVRPVMTIFWNDVLLDAKQLRANGRPESLTTRVPPYVMGINNTLRVSVQRAVQHSTASAPKDFSYSKTGFPITVLPSSHILKGAANPDGTFAGVLPLLAGTPQLFVPPDYFVKPATSVQTLINLAISTGLSVHGTTLVEAADNRRVVPNRAFVAMETQIDGVARLIRANKDGQIHANSLALPSVTVADQLSAAQVVRSHGQDGLIWYPVNSTHAQLEQPFDMNFGTAVLLDSSGPRIWFDGDEFLTRSRTPQSSAFYVWRRNMPWSIPLIVILIFAFLILVAFAARARKRHENLK